MFWMTKAFGSPKNEGGHRTALTSEEDRDRFARQVMIYTLGHLYEQGKISSGLGARVLGTDRS